MTYSVMELIEIFDGQFPYALNCIFNRIPLLVRGYDSELLDDLVSSLALLCPQRHQMVFWRDFTAKDEFRAIWDEEKHNTEVDRSVFCCFSSNVELLVERISNFSSWMIALPTAGSLPASASTNPHSVIREKALEHCGNVGTILVESPSVMTFSLAKHPEGNLELERSIVKKISIKRKQSLERIRRLLSKSLRDLNVSPQIMQIVLQLEDEAKKLTSDVFKEEVNKYIHAARRAATILSRVRLAREMGASITLTDRSLCEAIGWKYGDIDSILRLIHAEWHEDFSDCVRNGRFSGLGAWVDSMWGGGT
ncbi:MAG: hypothetical protein R6V83_10885 [Candidatus Thorarchaeota archaeon]